MFHRKDGSLTAYAFACGYIQRQTIGSKQITLWVEHGCHHVRAHDFNSDVVHTESGVRGRLFWLSFDTLTEARKIYRQKLRELKKK